MSPIRSERYRVVRQIGAGGMGIVYEAEDLERGQTVALKTLESPDIEQVYRLKREFRVLADLGHPNLVSLFDLVADHDSCFFTMELLDGGDLLAHVRGRSSHHTAFAATTQQPVAGNFPSSERVAGIDPTEPFQLLAAGDAPTEPPRKPTTCDLDRLRAVLPQLARGLHALHAAGKIHRDVKPSNIRVTSAGRAVLLDFGLAAELERRPTTETGVVGTIPYMAPEQCAGDAVLTPAADWYALGTLMFEALTGALPFDGPPTRVLYDKQTRPARRASQLVSNVPHELDQLCADLLEREPSDRPTGKQILERLGTRADTGSRSSSSRSALSGFAGRAEELAQLDEALATTLGGRASIAVVRGPSGQGKSTLVARFLDRVRARASEREVVVLRGRCLDTEDVPYKAIDHLVDELSEWWLALGARDAESILPRDACLLPTLFPVLERVPAIADAPRTRSILDPQARRTHAFDAFREALQRIADRRTLVLFLDDMQWVDRDTQALLADVMRAPDPPPLLLVLTTRDDDAAVLELVGKMDAARVQLDLGPLSERDAYALALSHLGGEADPLARKIVHEADGNPLFLVELVRHQGRDVESVAGRGLDAMLADKIDQLGDAARAVAELVAVAGEPVTRRLLALATQLAGPELTRQLGNLRAEHVVRLAGSRADDTIEPYHARIRRAVLAAMPAERRSRHHRSLAIALSGTGTSEQLARHWYSAGDVEHAAPHARRAADDARRKLDFDLSARWYAIALEAVSPSEVAPASASFPAARIPAGEPAPSLEARELRALLADALAFAGRPREAADQFLLATRGADAVTSLELRRRAAGSLLQSGYLAEGLALTKEVLAAVGLKMAKTPMRALLSLLVRRAWLRLRGLGFKRREKGELTQAALTKVDVCENVSFGLVVVDTFRSMEFGVRFLAGALRLGEPYRISRAFALEADFLAATAKRERANRVVDHLAKLSATIDDPEMPSQLLTTRAFLDFFLENRFRAAHDGFDAAIAKYRAVVGRAGFELETVSMFQCWSLYYLGELADLSRRVPAMHEAATRGGNRYTAITLRCAFPAAWLARMAPVEIEGEVDRAIASWTTPDGGYQLQHLFALCSRIDLALYRGAPGEVTARIARETPLLRRALLDRPPVQALLLHGTFAKHALALAAAAPPGSSGRRDATAMLVASVRRFRKSPVPLCGHVATLFDGARSELDGNADAAITCYRRAETGFDALEAHLYGHAVRDRIGMLMGGDTGATLRAGTRGWLDRNGVRDPDTMLAMLLPRI